MTCDPDPHPRTIYTVGHSTHALDTFVTLLRSHEIQQIADVRLIPKSGRYPHFSDHTLPRRLAEHDIGYAHFRDLGGRRRPRPDSPNTAWRVEAFRGYADYMQTVTFESAVTALLAFAANGRTAVMCAEAVWWQCHRRLLADFLIVRRIHVFHVLPTGPAKAHELSEFAHVEGRTVTYPGLI